MVALIDSCTFQICKRRGHDSVTPPWLKNYDKSAVDATDRQFFDDERIDFDYLGIVN